MDGIASDSEGIYALKSNVLFARSGVGVSACNAVLPGGIFRSDIPSTALPCGMPYRIDIRCPPPDAVDVLVQLGALDIEPLEQGLAAILPDSVDQHTVVSALGAASVNVSPAVSRDSSSVWLLSPPPVRIGGLLIASPPAASSSSTLKLIDSDAFGTGHHPTTALCLEALQDLLSVERIDRVLDVGAGSGILALAALMLGVPHAVGLDIDAGALKVAAGNAELNNLADRFELILGGPGVVNGSWPLVVANVLAAPLIEMAPVLVRRVSSAGRLILSGIPCSLESEVRHAYQHFGMRHVSSKTRAGWTLLVAQASW